MHLTYESKIEQDRERWLARANEKLNKMENLSSSPLLLDSSILTPTTDSSAESVAIMVQGVLSAASNPLLDPIAMLFQAPTRAIYFNYRGHGEPPYEASDTLEISITVLSNRLAHYFDIYKRARFHLVCHSLGGLIAMKAIYDRRNDVSFWGRIESLSLLASPVRMHGLSSEEARALNLNNRAWGICEEYNVVIRSLPIELFSHLAAVHCEDDRDKIAFYEETCLMGFEIAGFGLVDEWVESTGISHFNMPKAEETLKIMKGLISRGIR